MNTPPAMVRLLETPSGPENRHQCALSASDPAAVNLQKAGRSRRCSWNMHLSRRIPVREELEDHGIAVVDDRRNRSDSSGRRDVGADDGACTRHSWRRINSRPLRTFSRKIPKGSERLRPALDQALALVPDSHTLVEQQDGRKSLARLMREWPRGGGDSVAMLKNDFPQLASDGGNLQKWWTLNLAPVRRRRIAIKAIDRGRNGEGTRPLPRSSWPPGKDGEKKTFKVSEFEHFVKTRGIRAILNERHAAIIALGSHANALYRPVIADYRRPLFALLAKGKTERRPRSKIAQRRNGRATIVIRRMSEIGDYLN